MFQNANSILTLPLFCLPCCFLPPPVQGCPTAAFLPSFLPLFLPQRKTRPGTERRKGKGAQGKKKSNGEKGQQDLEVRTQHTNIFELCDNNYKNIVSSSINQTFCLKIMSKFASIPGISFLQLAFPLVSPSVGGKSAPSTACRPDAQRPTATPAPAPAAADTPAAPATTSPTPPGPPRRVSSPPGRRPGRRGASC